MFPLYISADTELIIFKIFVNNSLLSLLAPSSINLVQNVPLMLIYPSTYSHTFGVTGSGYIKANTPMPFRVGAMGTASNQINLLQIHKGPISSVKQVNFCSISQCFKKGLSRKHFIKKELWIVYTYLGK